MQGSSQIMLRTHKDLHARHGHQAGLDALLLELLQSFQAERNLGTGRDEGDISCSRISKRPVHNRRADEPFSTSSST